MPTLDPVKNVPKSAKKEEEKPNTFFLAIRACESHTDYQVTVNVKECGDSEGEPTYTLYALMVAVVSQVCPRCSNHGDCEDEQVLLADIKEGEQ